MSIRTTGNERDESGSCLCRPTGVCLSNTYSNHHLILDVKECVSVSVSVCVRVCAIAFDLYSRNSAHNSDCFLIYALFPVLSSAHSLRQSWQSVNKWQVGQKEWCTANQQATDAGRGQRYAEGGAFYGCVVAAAKLKECRFLFCLLLTQWYCIGCAMSRTGKSAHTSEIFVISLLFLHWHHVVVSN